AAGEVHLARHLNQGPECYPLERHRMATPQRVQVDAMTVIRANHSQAGEPAFSCFGLPHNREVAPAAEIQEAHNSHIMTLEEGSRIDVINWSAIIYYPPPWAMLSFPSSLSFAFIAATASSVRFAAPNLCMMRRTCTLTVASERPSSRAILLFG